MAISKVKLPDNSVHEIHDSRLPSVYPRIYVGTCSTAAATAAKVVTTEEFPLVNGNPVVGTTIAVKFTNTNSGASPTLNVNNTGAHSIYYSNAVYTSNGNIAGYANRYSYYVWDGTNWVWLSHGASADASGKQDKWAEVGTLEGVTTLTPTSTGGAVALVDGEQAIGLGYMHFVEGQDLPDAYTLGIDSNGFKAEALDENAGALITLDGNGLAMHSTPITGLPTPTANDEAATKGYVDSVIPTSLSQLSDDSTHRVVTDAEKATWNAKADIFVANITTTYAEIAAAVAAGKTVLCKFDLENDDLTSMDDYEMLLGWCDEGVLYGQLGHKEDDAFDFICLTNYGPDAYFFKRDNTCWYYIKAGVIPTPVQFDRKYVKPDNGIPKSDLASSVQITLNKADRAYQKPSTGIPASDLASGVIPSVPVTDVTVGGTSVVSSGTAVIPAIPAAQVNSDWNASSGLAQILNKPDLSDYALATGDNSYDFAANSIRLVYEPQPGTTVNVPLTFALGRLHVSIPSGGAFNTNKNVAFTDDIPSVPVQDVTVGGTSVVSNGTAVIPAIPSVPVTDVTVGGTSVVSSGTAVIPAIPTVPTISTNVVTDKASDTKTSSPKSVYDEIHPATQSSQPAGGFLPNVVYNLGTLSGNTTFALATPADSSVANHYYWTFDTPSTAPTITWPASITGWNGGSAPTINASKHYEISVLNGIGAFMEV